MLGHQKRENFLPRFCNWIWRLPSSLWKCRLYLIVKLKTLTKTNFCTIWKLYEYIHFAFVWMESWDEMKFILRQFYRYMCIIFTLISCYFFVLRVVLASNGYSIVVTFVFVIYKLYIFVVAYFVLLLPVFLWECDTFYRQLCCYTYLRYVLSITCILKFTMSMHICVSFESLQWECMSSKFYYPHF
jgi:hypothetical protein